MRHIQALLWHIDPYSDVFRTLCNLCIYKDAIFRTLGYLKRTLGYLKCKASSKACWTSKMIRHIQSPGIVKQFIQAFQGYLGIFSDFDAYSFTLRHYSFRKTIHLKCLTLFSIPLYLVNCSVICKVTFRYVHWKF